MMNYRLNAKRILLVEDEPSVCDVCLRVLTDEGFDVDVAANGRVAVDKIAKRDYDLIIIDLKTPVMDGKKLYKIIGEQYPKLLDRIVFTTGDYIVAENQEFLEALGEPFLAKPFTPHELIEIVRGKL